MTSKNSLSSMLASLSDDIEHQLKQARITIDHAGTKGDASEDIWLDLMRLYLPKRYQVEKAKIVDSDGNISDQIDIVIFDRQYTPFIFVIKGAKYVPAEAVYAIFEAKQDIGSANIKYSKNKIESDRKLHRTSLPIRHSDGVMPPKPLHHILGGIVCLDSEWSPQLGEPLIKHLGEYDPNDSLDLGCVASHGIFTFDKKNEKYMIKTRKKAATLFIFELIALLQEIGTVPMIDIRAYSKWL
jgi:hypothetical protein